jgi:hypothetical protein
VYAWLLPNLTWLHSATWIPVAESVPVPNWLAGAGPRPELAPESAAQLHAATAVHAAVGFTALYLLYLMAIRLARGRPRLLGVAVVVTVAVLAQAIAVAAPFALSSDLYSYAIYGRILAVYGGSPYLEPPIQYAGDRFYPYVYWMHVPSFYGPLWTLISGQVADIAGDHVGLTAALYRAVAAGSVLFAAVLVFLLLRRVDPERALVGATLIAWCPLVIVESGLSAHNDILMSLLIVVGLVLAWPRRAILSVAAAGAVVLACLVKLSALPLLPLLGVYLLRTARSWPARFGIALGSAVVAVALTTAIVMPVWSGPATFAVGTLGSGPDRYVNSLAETALAEVRRYLGATTDDLEVPLQFSGWWVGTHTQTLLYATRTGDEAMGELPAWSDLLVVGPERDGRLRVFDPVSRQVGFADAWTLGPIDPPSEWMRDPEVEARSRGPVGSADLIEANRLIRWVGWGAFLLAFLAALLFGTGSPAALVRAWVGLCLVLEYITLTWFWPWYVLWGLLPAALTPRSRLTRLTVYLGWGVLLAYALMGFQDTRLWFLHNYRALPMFGLPLIVFVADELLRGLYWLTAILFRRRQPIPDESVPESIVLHRFP